MVLPALHFLYIAPAWSRGPENYGYAQNVKPFSGEKRKGIDKSHAKKPGGCIWQHPGERVHASVIESARTLSGLYPYRARHTTDLAGGQDFFESECK